MKIDCDRVLNLSDRLAQLSNICYEKAEEIHIEKLRISENSLTDEILKNLDNDRKRIKEQAEKLKRYSIALKRIVAVYTKGENNICDIIENGVPKKRSFFYLLKDSTQTFFPVVKGSVPQISLKAE